MLPNVITALITPFDKNYHIVNNDLYQCIIKQNEVGNAIVIFGSTGEGFGLTLIEKKMILDFCLTISIEVPLLVAINSPFLSECLDLIDYCQNKKVFGFLLTVPPYAKPGPNGQEEWFRHLMDQSKKPCLLYNIPSRSGVELHPEVVKNLATHPYFYGIKDSGRNLSSFLTYKASIPDYILPKIQLYCGEDNLIGSTASLGVSGLISIMSNVWPLATKIYVQQCLKNKVQNIDLWLNAAEAICYNNPLSVKNLMAHKKIITSNTVRPPLNNKDSKNLENVLFYDQCIDNWIRSAE